MLEARHQEQPIEHSAKESVGWFIERLESANVFHIDFELFGQSLAKVFNTCSRSHALDQPDPVFLGFQVRPGQVAPGNEYENIA